MFMLSARQNFPWLTSFINVYPTCSLLIDYSWNQIYFTRGLPQVDLSLKTWSHKTFLIIIKGIRGDRMIAYLLALLHFLRSTTLTFIHSKENAPLILQTLIKYVDEQLWFYFVHCLYNSTWFSVWPFALIRSKIVIT